MEIQGFTLVNVEKVGRALNGVPREDNSTIGGVGHGAYFDVVWKKDSTDLGEDEVVKLEKDLLAEYDRLGGFIKKGNDKVMTGSFYDFKGKKPRSEPKVVFIYRFGTKTVEVPDGKELPGEVKAAKILKEREVEEREHVQKVKRVKKNT